MQYSRLLENGIIEKENVNECLWAFVKVLKLVSLL